MRNDRSLDLNERKIDHFRSFIPRYGSFADIKNIKLNKMAHVTYSTLFDKHDKL